MAFDFMSTITPPTFGGNAPVPKQTNWWETITPPSFGTQQTPGDTMAKLLEQGAGMFGANAQQAAQQMPSGIQPPPTGYPTPGAADNWADAGTLMEKMASNERVNRVLKGNWMQDYDQLMLQAQQGRNQNESDALKKLAQTGYILGGGSQFKLPTINLNGMPVQATDWGLAPPKISAAQTQGAGTLQQMALDRLKPGGSYTPTDPSTYVNPGLTENIGKWGGVAAGAGGILENILGGGASGQQKGMGQVGGAVGGAVNKVGDFLGGLFGGGQQAGKGGIPGLMNNIMPGESGGMPTGFGPKIPGVGQAAGAIGKILPYAGAIQGGMGLMKDQGFGKNLMNGVTTGASIGSIVPGLGTAVGAGIGAGVGALRGLFGGGGPSQEELAGRAAQNQKVSGIISGATPQQKQEAQAAGWGNPDDALAQIVLRDALMKAGYPNPDQQAGQWLRGMWDAEQGGAGAVGAAASPIQSLLARG